MKKSGLAVVFLFSLAAGALAQTTEVTLATGQLRGSTEAGVTSFKGIPYAAPPVGALRWRDPQPATKWRGIRDATRFAPDCVQGLRVGKEVPPDPSGNAEDCLYLNIWRPAGTATKLPVMVWIHGGGFVFGGSSLPVFDGAAYARRGVILVSLNYRLGRFGFFAHPALKAEAPKDIEANYGLADQLAALQWVRSNITAFGGDPENTTLFGESAGGMSVLAMITSPLTNGLFQRSIVQSGLGRPFKSDTYGEPSLIDGESRGIAFAQLNGIEGTGPEALTKLRALPPDKVRDIQLDHGRAYSGPVIDGKLVTGIPSDLFTAGGGHRIALIVGATSADLGNPESGSLDAAFSRFGPHAAEARAAYNPEGRGDPAVITREIAMDREMEEPARFIAKTYAVRGLPAFEYRFSYVPAALRAANLGARHSSDNAYVFDTIGGPAHSVDSADQAMSDDMVGYWSNFARTGDPNGPGLPHWPLYNPQSDILMNFTNTGPTAMPDPWKPRLDAVEAAAQDLRRADASLSNSGVPQ